MNGSAIQEVMNYRENLVNTLQDFEEKLKSFVLHRAKGKCIYLPLAKLIHEEIDKSLAKTRFYSRIYLNEENKIFVEHYNHNVGNNCQFVSIPLSDLTQEKKQTLLLSINEEILCNQSYLRDVYNEFYLSFEYYTADSKFRHALCKTINGYYLSKQNVLGKEFIIRICDGDYKKELTLRWCNEQKTLREVRPKEAPKDANYFYYPRPLANFNVQILKLIKLAIHNKVYKIENT